MVAYARQKLFARHYSLIVNIFLLYVRMFILINVYLLYITKKDLCQRQGRRHNLGSGGGDDVEILNGGSRNDDDDIEQ